MLSVFAAMLALTAGASWLYWNRSTIVATVPRWWNAFAFDAALLPGATLDRGAERLQARVFAADVVVWNRGTATTTPPAPLRIRVPRGRIVKAIVRRATTPGVTAAAAGDTVLVSWQHLGRGDGALVTIAYTAPAAARPLVAGAETVGFSGYDRRQVRVFFLALLFVAAVSLATLWHAPQWSAFIIMFTLSAAMIWICLQITATHVPWELWPAIEAAR